MLNVVNNSHVENSFVIYVYLRKGMNTNDPRFYDRVTLNLEKKKIGFPSGLPKLTKSTLNLEKKKIGFPSGLPKLTKSTLNLEKKENWFSIWAPKTHKKYTKIPNVNFKTIKENHNISL